MGDGTANIRSPTRTTAAVALDSPSSPASVRGPSHCSALLSALHSRGSLDSPRSKNWRSLFHLDAESASEMPGNQQSTGSSARHPQDDDTVMSDQATDTPWLWSEHSGAPQPAPTATAVAPKPLQLPVSPHKTPAANAVALLAAPDEPAHHLASPQPQPPATPTPTHAKAAPAPPSPYLSPHQPRHPAAHGHPAPFAASSPASPAPAVSRIHPAAAALHSGRMGLAFSGGGFLIVYFIGVLKALEDLGVVARGRTPCAGASAGAIVTTSWTAGVPIPLMLQLALRQAQLHRLTTQAAATVAGPAAAAAAAAAAPTTDQMLRAALTQLLPQDAAVRCTDKVHIALTAVAAAPTATHPVPTTSSTATAAEDQAAVDRAAAAAAVLASEGEPLLVSEFLSKADLVEAVAASAFLPYWSAATATTTFRGIPAVDGGFTSPLPLPTTPCDYIIEVCACPIKNLIHQPHHERQQVPSADATGSGQPTSSSSAAGVGAGADDPAAPGSSGNTTAKGSSSRVGSGSIMRKTSSDAAFAAVFTEQHALASLHAKHGSRRSAIRNASFKPDQRQVCPVSPFSSPMQQTRAAAPAPAGADAAFSPGDPASDTGMPASPPTVFKEPGGLGELGSTMRPPRPHDVDIAPDLYGNSCWSDQELVQFPVMPPDPPTLLQLFLLGVEDAASWAKQALQLDASTTGGAMAAAVEMVEQLAAEAGLLLAPAAAGVAAGAGGSSAGVKCVHDAAKRQPTLSDWLAL